MSESTVFTKLIDKHRSPAVIRKYTKWGFPLFVALITDNSLEDLDDTVIKFVEKEKGELWVNNIQQVRNLVGLLSEHLIATYDRTEGVAVIAYCDKCMINSLYGDHMNHTQCKIELFLSLNLMAHI